MTGWKIALWVFVVALVLFFFYSVRSILLPFILGFVIAVLLEPLVRKLRVRGMKRNSAVMLVFTVFFVALIGLVAVTIPVVSRQVVSLTNTATGFTRNLEAQSYANNYFVRWNPKLRIEASSQVAPLDKALLQFSPMLDRVGLPSSQSAIVAQYVEPRRAEISKLVQGFFNSFLGAASSFGTLLLLLPLTPFVVLFILLDYDRIKMTSPTWIPPSIRRQTLSLMQDVGDVFLKYLRGLTISWACYTLTLGVVLTLFGAPFGFLLAILFGALYLIPFIGGVLNYIILFVVTGLSGVSGNLFMHMPSSWAFAVVLFGVQFALTWLWDSVFHPRLVGSAVGLSPLVSMFVVIAGGALFGITGMVLAFPIGGAIKVILQRVMKVATTTGSDTLGLPSVPLRHRVQVER